MVRRRARTTATTSKTNGSNSSELFKNMVNIGNTTMIEDQFFTSPRRKKDCKVEHSNNVVAVPVNKLEIKICSKSTKLWNISKLKHEKGVSLSTRAQTKTIENFFKAKTKDEEKTDAIEMAKTDTFNQMTEHHNRTEFKSSFNCKISVCSMEKNQDVETAKEKFTNGLSPEMETGVTVVFSTKNSSFRIDDTSCCNGIIDNIFLQEPVLKLNFEKASSSNNMSCIEVQNGIEETSFPSPSESLPVENSRNNQYISPRKRDRYNCDSSSKYQPKENTEEINEHFCKDVSLKINTIVDKKNIMAQKQYDPLTPSPNAPTRRRKPATPHRIVCPSPVKTMTTATTVLSPKKTDQLQLPSKIQNQFVNTAFKSRRRLKQPKQEEETVLQHEQNQKLCNGTISKNINKDKPNKSKIPNDDDNKNNGSEISKEDSSLSSNKQSLVKRSHQPTKIKMKNGLQPLHSTNGNRELSEFFPVRRSVRKTKTAVKEEMMRHLEQAILEERSEGLRIEYFEGKGRGVVTDRCFRRGEFVIEYIGDLISITEAMEREKKYALDENAGCYMYYFKHKNQQYCIDATSDTGRLGRLVNHSRNGNLVTKIVVVKQRPHLILIAKDDIVIGEEITYDYGDRSKESLLHHPWLAF